MDQSLLTRAILKKKKKKHWRKKFFLVDFAVLYMIKAKTIKPSIIHPTLYECSVIWSANNNYNKINNNKTYLLHCYCCYIFTTKQKNMYCYFWLRFFSFFFGICYCILLWVIVSQIMLNVTHDYFVISTAVTVFRILKSQQNIWKREIFSN